MPCRSYIIDSIVIVGSIGTYEKGLLEAFLVLREGILDANLSQEHFLRRVVRRVLDYFQILSDYRSKETRQG